MNRLKVGRKMSREQMVKEIKADPMLFAGKCERLKLGRMYRLNRNEIYKILDEVICADPDLESLSLRKAGVKYGVSDHKIYLLKRKMGMRPTMVQKGAEARRGEDSKVGEALNYPGLMTEDVAVVCKALGIGKNTVARARRMVEADQEREHRRLINKFILRGAA